jgi:hypothetical protein
MSWIIGLSDRDQATDGIRKVQRCYSVRSIAFDIARDAP